MPNRLESLDTDVLTAEECTHSIRMLADDANERLWAANRRDAKACVSARVMASYPG